MNRHFQTSDLWLAAFLLAGDHTLAGIDGQDPQRVVFLLAPYPAPDLLASYAEGRATVNALRFISAERQLKRRVWAVRDGREARR